MSGLGMPSRRGLFVSAFPSFVFALYSQIFCEGGGKSNVQDFMAQTKHLLSGRQPFIDNKRTFLEFTYQFGPNKINHVLKPRREVESHTASYASNVQEIDNRSTTRCLETVTKHKMSSVPKSCAFHLRWPLCICHKKQKARNGPTSTCSTEPDGSQNYKREKVI